MSASERWRRSRDSPGDLGAPVPFSGNLRVLRRSLRISSCALFTCVAVISAADLMIWLCEPPVGVQALFDEPAHAATAFLALGTVAVAVEAPVVLAVLAGSVLIDMDHVPGLLGSDVLQHATPRPYTHSLLTLIVVIGAVLLVPHPKRKLLIVAALALVLHFFRDMAEPGGAGVALLWPISNRAYNVGYGWYAAVIGLLAAIGLATRAAPSARPRPIE